MTPKKKKEKNEYVKEKLRQMKKESKKNKHRARLVVRNLPFATTEENLREHFEQFGEIDEIKLLKKEDQKLLGVGFVQFKLVQKAAKARHHLNAKPFLDRNIECDWAMPKDKYIKTQAAVEIAQVKDEPIDQEITIKTEDLEIKQEPEDEQENSEQVVKNKNELSEENDFEENNESSIKQMKMQETSAERQKTNENSFIEEEADEDSVEEESDKDDSFINEEDEEVKETGNIKEGSKKSKPRVVSNDVTEGKTIFIKNVPFTATNEDVKSCLSQFGPLFYAVVCMDPLTEHSKGTAFVKFRNKKDADECVLTPGITLMGNKLECQYAISKDDLIKKSNDKKDKGPRDSRNLYLVKEGVILAGSKAAEGVSASDMAKRLQIEQYKTQMLRNLNMFVARTRLIVHNVPPTWDDDKLRKLFMKYSAPNAVIKEARVMRNMRLTDGWGVGKSKEYGFVTFTTHEAALHALRIINNNPNIFSTIKRPIIAFSIENKAKLEAKKKRLQNSLLKNPKCKNYDPKTAKYTKTTENKRGVKRPISTDAKEEVENFTGIVAKPGVKKMRSKFNLKTQAQIHHAQLKKEKKNKKFGKKTLNEKQKDFTKQPRQKINRNKIQISDSFSKIVNNYKQKLLNANQNNQTRKQKWYEET